MGALRMKASKLEAPLDSSMPLESPQARKNPLSSYEKTVPGKTLIGLGSRMGAFPWMGKNPPKRRGLLKKNPRLNGPRRVGL